MSDVDYDSASFKEGFQMGSAEEWMRANDLRTAARDVLDFPRYTSTDDEDRELARRLNRLREALDNDDTVTYDAR